MFSCHLHSWCLQRSTQTSGGEHCCFLQASEEQPLETPCEVTTCSLSEGCSWPRGTECPLNLKSLIHPGWKNGDRSLKRATKHTQSAVFNTQFESAMCKFSFCIQGASDTATGSRGVLLSRVSLHSQLTVRCSYQSLYSIICGGKYRNNSSSRLTPQTHKQDYVFFSLQIIYVYISLSNKYLNTKSRDAPPVNWRRSYRVGY